MISGESGVRCSAIYDRNWRLESINKPKTKEVSTIKLRARIQPYDGIFCACVCVFVCANNSIRFAADAAVISKPSMQVYVWYTFLMSNLTLFCPIVNERQSANQIISASKFTTIRTRASIIGHIYRWDGQETMCFCCRICSRQDGDDEISGHWASFTPK